MPVGTERSGEEAARAAACLARLYLPQDDSVLLADPSAENRAWLQAEYPGRQQQLTDAARLRAAVLERHGEALKDEAVEGLERRLPELSARRVFSRGQVVTLLLLCALMAAALVLRPLMLLHGVVLALSAAFVASGLFRALLAWVGAASPPPPRAPSRQGLPSYTILVPLYREAVMLPALARALNALDYPSRLLDVKLVLEEDDAETIAAAAALGEHGYEIITVPNHGPRTKPKEPDTFLSAFPLCMEVFDLVWFFGRREAPPVFPGPGLAGGFSLGM